MKAAVSAVLSQKEAVGCAVSAYIDDIYVDEDVVPATHVREDLVQFGLKCKDMEWLEDGTRLLGLTVGMEHDELLALSGVWLATCNTQEVSQFGHEGLGWWSKRHRTAV